MRYRYLLMGLLMIGGAQSARAESANVDYFGLLGDVSGHTMDTVIETLKPIADTHPKNISNLHSCARKISARNPKIKDDSEKTFALVTDGCGAELTTFMDDCIKRSGQDNCSTAASLIVGHATTTKDPIFNE